MERVKSALGGQPAEATAPVPGLSRVRGRRLFAGTSPPSWSPLCAFSRAASLGLRSPPLSTPSGFRLHCSSGPHLQNLGFVRPLHPPVCLAGDSAEQLVEILLSRPWQSPSCLSLSPLCLPIPCSLLILDGCLDTDQVLPVTSFSGLGAVACPPVDP